MAAYQGHFVLHSCIVTKAEKLSAKDSNGFSDPYCVIGFVDENDKWLGEKVKSKVEKKTRNPTFRWPGDGKGLTSSSWPQLGPNRYNLIKIEVWDDDLIGKDLIGTGLVGLNDILLCWESEGKKISLQHPKDNFPGAIFVKGKIEYFPTEEEKKADKEKEEKARQAEEEAKRRQEEEERLEKEAAEKREEEKRQAVEKSFPGLCTTWEGKITAAGVKSDWRQTLRDLAYFDPSGSTFSEPDALYSFLQTASVSNVVSNAPFFGVSLRISPFGRTYQFFEAPRNFFVCDYDQDGKVDFGDLVIALSFLRSSDPAEVASYMFRILSKGTNEKLTADNFRTVATYAIAQTLADVNEAKQTKLYGSLLDAGGFNSTIERRMELASLAYLVTPYSSVVKRAVADMTKLQVAHCTASAYVDGRAKAEEEMRSALAKIRVDAGDEYETLIQKLATANSSDVDAAAKGDTATIIRLAESL